MSKADPYYGDGNIVTLAYEIIAMHKEIEFLRSERDHYKELHEMHLETIKASDKHTKEMTSMILNAALDPESAINQGHGEEFKIVKKDNTIKKIKVKSKGKSVRMKTE